MLAAEGKLDIVIAAQLSISSPKAARWRNRFLASGLEELKKDVPRPGRTPWDQARVSPPSDRKNPSNQAVERKPRVHANARGGDGNERFQCFAHLAGHSLKPHLIETFKISNDPHFADKLEEIVGLYLNPPEHALVLSVDEKSQIKALDRTQPGSPLKRGRGAMMTHDYNATEPPNCSPHATRGAAN